MWKVFVFLGVIALMGVIAMVKWISAFLATRRYDRESLPDMEDETESPVADEDDYAFNIKEETYEEN